MKQETIDGNRLIAEFMGASHVVDGDLMYNKESQFYCGLYACPVNQLLYNSSWDWLMPIWFKIQYWYTREFGVLTSVFEISNTGISIKATHTSAFRYAWPITKREVTIEDIYTAVVEFIKWYNNQNSNA